jgi:hypothetical protein
MLDTCRKWIQISCWIPVPVANTDTGTIPKMPDIKNSYAAVQNNDVPVYAT